MNAEARTMERPLRWPLMQQPANRDETISKDASIVNAIAERDPNTGEWIVEKRIGTTIQYNVGATYTFGSGLYGWKPISGATSQGVYSVFSNGTIAATMYKDGTAFGTVGGLDPGSGFGGAYRFVECPGATSTPTATHLVFASTAHVYYIANGGAAWNTAAIPAHGSFVRGIATLDSTVYFMDETGAIYGSNLADPTTWSALNVVYANSIAGEAIALTQQLNYVIALKSNSMEVFYDAANPTGSPLSPYAGGLSSFGCFSAGSVQVIDDILFYISSNHSFSPQVIRVDNLQTRVISTPAVERLLDQGGGGVSWTFKHGGHRFYGVSVQDYFIQFGVVGSLMMVYDIDQNLWYQWTSPPAVAPSSNVPFNAIGMTITVAGQHVLQGISDASVYIFEGDYKYPTDNGVVVPVDIYTPNTDFETRRRKTLHRMYFRTDQTPGSLLYVRRSDDDYQTWSVPRKVDLGKKIPYIKDEGTFTKRAYHFRHSAPTAFRMRSSDLQMDFGTI